MTLSKRDLVFELFSGNEKLLNDTLAFFDMRGYKTWASQLKKLQQDILSGQFNDSDEKEAFSTLENAFRTFFALDKDPTPLTDSFKVFVGEYERITKGFITPLEDGRPSTKRDRAFKVIMDNAHPLLTNLESFLKNAGYPEIFQQLYSLQMDISMEEMNDNYSNDIKDFGETSSIDDVVRVREADKEDPEFEIHPHIADGLVNYTPVTVERFDLLKGIAVILKDHDHDHDHDLYVGVTGMIAELDHIFGRSLKSVPAPPLPGPSFDR